jgi:hypothetical protein
MKNISIRGLQISGTNYIRQLIIKNIDVNIINTHLYTELDYQQISEYLKNGETGDYNFDLWKHNLTPLSKDLIEKYKIDGFLLISKNPYSWLESIIYRNKIDLDITYNEKFKFFEDGVFRIDNLCKLYKDFYTNWINNDTYFIKYEDLLINKEKVLIEFVNKFNLTFKFKEIQEINQKVDASHQFKDSFIKKYINVELSHLQNEEIKLINEILGEDFFNKIGYEMKSPN